MVGNVYLSVDKQIENLILDGVIISDKSYAKEILENISYHSSNNFL